MLTDVQIINNGLSLIAQSRITRIDPARTPLEAYMASNYAQWKRTELAKRRWVFAIVTGYQLTQVTNTSPVLDGRKYKFAMPIDCLRPLRNKQTEWVQRGRFIYSSQATLYLDYIRNVPESDFDALFNEVLSAAIAWKSAEYVTQSQAKKDSAANMYALAVREAGQANAFIIGPEDIGPEDDEPTWLDQRVYG